jgi:hypothetical protein
MFLCLPEGNKVIVMNFEYSALHMFSSPMIQLFTYLLACNYVGHHLYSTGH